MHDDDGEKHAHHDRDSEACSATLTVAMVWGIQFTPKAAAVFQTAIGPGKMNAGIGNSTTISCHSTTRPARVASGVPKSGG